MKLLLLVLLLGVAMPLSAQSEKQAEKLAVKALKVATKTQSKTFKSSIKKDLKVLLLEFSFLEGELKAGNYSSVKLNDLFDEVETFQGAVMVAKTNALNGMNTAGQEALGDFEANAPADSPVPADLFRGTGQGLDQIMDEMNRELDKAYGLLRKRLEKLGGLLEKKAAVGMTFRLRPPAHIGVKTFYSAFGTVSSSTMPLLWDFLASFSALGVENDGVIRSSGTALGASVTVTAAFSIAGEEMVNIASSRWSSTLSGSAAENVMLSVKPPTGSSIAVTLGVR